MKRFTGKAALRYNDTVGLFGVVSMRDCDQNCESNRKKVKYEERI